MTTIYPDPATIGHGKTWNRPVRLTALYREHVARGAGVTFVESDEWLVPASFGALPEEEAAVHEAVGLLDVGGDGKIDLKGVVSDLNAVLTAAFPGTRQVSVGVSLPVRASGTTRLARLTDQQLLVLTGAGELPGILRLLERANETVSPHCVHLTDVTSALCGLRLLGPRSPEMLERLCSCDVSPDRFVDSALVQATVASVHALIVRHDSVSLIGYDLYVDRDLGPYLWNTLLENGSSLGIRPVGRNVGIGLSEQE